MELVDLTFNNVNEDESELVFLKKGENLCLPQGQCVLTVQLNNDDVSRAEGEEPEREEVEVEEEEVEFYCLFSGSTQRHVTSTVRVSRVTLQAVCPAHHVCEQVLVTLCWARPGAPVDSHSQETFTFVQDLALDMAHFLLDSTDPQEALLLDDEQIPLKVCKRLDQSLALALEHLSLPYHTRVQTCTQRDVGIHMNHHTQTDAQTHSDINGCPSATCTDPYLEMSTWMDRRYGKMTSWCFHRLCPWKVS
uniref:Uncharacterized protein n=1 Tax=Cynoglossus semilaevis TaxID=244447 RepID=A0A3P8UPF5_CYNSE